MKNSLCLLIAILLLGGCSETSEYDRLVERELESGEVHNELFLGYELGMPRDSFYDHSWALNRRGLVMQGPENQTVQYEIKEGLPHPAKMFFYPDFYDGSIFQMRVRFLYDGWAPWNKNLSADSLQVDVMRMLEDWYGGGFIEWTGTGSSSAGRSPADGSSGDRVPYVKVDGNRRIVLAKLTDSEVVAVITDLNAERKIEREMAGMQEARTTKP